MALLLGAALSSPFALSAARQDIQAGVVIEQRMAGGEAHSYGLKASPGARLLITVEQRGIDVAVEVLGPDGSTRIAVDGPWDRDGLESVLLPADVSGPLEVRVRSSKPGVAPGGYAIRLEVLPEGTPAERERIEAERLMTEAAAANLEGSAESLRLGTALYQEAFVRWRGLGRPWEEARCALAAGEIEASLGQPKPALELFQQALTLFAEEADEPGQAAAWSGLGVVRTALGDRVGGAAAQRQALELERGLGRPHQEAKALNNLGLAFHSQGELREAASLYERAFAVFEQAGEKGSWQVAVLQNLAAVYISLGEPEEALLRNRRVLELYRALGNGKGEARTLNNLGVVHGDLGELGQALESYSSALTIFRRSGDRLWEAALLHNRGAAYYELGDYGRALADQEQALEIRREAGDRRGEVSTEISLGYTRFRLGDIAQALAIGRRAAAAASAASDRRGEALARRLLGKVALATGEPAAALPELDRSLDLVRALEDRLEEASVLQLLGQAHLSLEQPEKAARILGEALDRSRAVRSPARIVSALTALAVAERRLGRPAEARSRVEEALRLIEAQRIAEGDPDLRASFLAAQHSAFEIEIDLLMELDRREPGQGFVQRALEVSERARARSLLDLLAEARADIREGVDPRLRDRERALLMRLNAKASRQVDLLKRPGSEDGRQEAEGEVRAVLDELSEIRAEIRRRSPRYAALTEPPVATVRDIQGLLDAGTLLLEYSLGEERSFLWAVDRDSVSGFELPGRARIEAAAHELYRRLSVLAPGDDRLGEAAADLSRMILGPVAGRLGERRLIVVADGELQYIPFGMLPVPEAGAPGGTAPLLARHEVVHAPSASAVALQRRLARREPAPGVVAVLADPVFDPADPRVPASAGTVSRAGNSLRSTALPAAVPFLRLPWTRREAEAIAAVAPAGQSLLALDFRASRETTLSPDLARYRIVHFATHGILDSRTPALSGLMLSKVGEHGTHRGLPGLERRLQPSARSRSGGAFRL